MRRTYTMWTLTIGFLLSWQWDADAEMAHVVHVGDTLWDLSRSYGCDVQRLREVNRLSSTQLDVGQKLAIPNCSTPVRAKSLGVVHRVAAGETLGHIAIRYKSTVADIQQRNGLSGTTIFVGGELQVLPGRKQAMHLPRLKISRGQSIGRPNRGRLANAARLPRGDGYFIRRPHRSFGASHTVSHVARLVARVRQRFPKVHRLAIGDLSVRHGGKISMHASHQSGRDVDLGFYFKRRPKGYPQSFVVGTRANLHFDANWTMLTHLVALTKSPTGVDKIFMSYSSQRLFYRLARKHGVTKKFLRGMFQYPAGKGASQGLIRHEPGHNEHIHVRFRCLPNDKRCS